MRDKQILLRHSVIPMMIKSLNDPELFENKTVKARKPRFKSLFPYEDANNLRKDFNVTNDLAYPVDLHVRIDSQKQVATVVLIDKEGTEVIPHPKEQINFMNIIMSTNY